MQMKFPRRGAAILAALAAPTAVMAQSTGRVLSEATIHEGDQCAIVGVGVNFPVRLISSFPSSFGDELRIRLSPIEGGDLAGMRSSRETVRPPSSKIAAINKIEFEGDRPEGPTLTITFDRKVNFKIAQGGDFRSLVLAVSGDRTNPECLPTQERPRDVAARGVDAPLPAATSPSATPDQVMSPADRGLITDSRAALTGGDYPRAIQVLTQLLSRPPGPATREARELLGIARERNGQAAHAKAEYEDYLKQFPEGPDADRVRQRLAALIASNGRPREVPGLTKARAARKGEWKGGGSVAAYYMHDESYQQIDDSQTRTTTTENDTNLNQVLSTLDAFGSYSSPRLRVKVRATGAFTNDFRPERSDYGALSALYIEASDPGQRLYGRLGRQTRSTGGVLGRFDGALISTRVAPGFKLEAVAGAPVNSPKDVAIDKDRYFYGASLAFGRFANAWDGDVYAIEQKSSGLIDRRAVGAELRYVAGPGSVFGAVDYDVYFKTLNFAILNGSWTYGQGGAVNFAVDYRKSPLLFTDNAGIGQAVFGLQDLRAFYTVEELRQLALDRTAPTRSVTLGVSQPITDKLTFNTDATVTDLEATPASGGVPDTPASGTEYYYSAQLIGSSLLKEGDIGILGLRYADTATSNRWVVDVNTRYPFTRALRINPRLRVGYRTSKTVDTTELSARPSLRLNYTSRHHLQFEPEIGGEWLRADTPTGRETTTGYFVNLGVRRDF